MRAYVTILLGGLALAGCGSDEQSQPQPATGGAAGQLTVTETDFALNPAKAQVAQAGEVAIKVTNGGKTAHALAIETKGTPSTETIMPGKSATLTAKLKPGRYTWYCPVDDHRGFGMSGTLTVGGETETETEPEPQPSAPASPGGGYGY